MIIGTNMSSARSVKKMRKLRGQHERELQEGLRRTSLGQAGICGRRSQIGMSSTKDTPGSLRKDVAEGFIALRVDDYLLQ